ncbi:MAG: DUF4880 domain-containing protein, partial [Saprospiraceae bacterium]|nr:DUF4880 domain-containing protein [Saprospiraceae bacterium]
MNDIHRFLAKELPPEELAAFVRWRAADPANEQLVRECEKVWDASGNYRVPAFSSADAWNKLNVPARV